MNVWNNDCEVKKVKEIIKRKQELLNDKKNQ